MSCWFRPSPARGVSFGWVDGLGFASVTSSFLPPSALNQHHDAQTTPSSHLQKEPGTSFDTEEPSLSHPTWTGLKFVDPSDLADVLLACDAAATAQNFGAAGAPAPLTAVARVLLRGFHPMAPPTLLLAARLVDGAAAAAVASKGGEAPEGRARRLLALLLRAAAGGDGTEASSEGVVTVGDGVAHALWHVASHTVPGAPEQQRHISAAARVLSALAPAELARAAADMAAAGKADAATGELCGRALAAAAEGADEAQAFALLDAPLGPGVWEEVWSVVVSPTRGTFCGSARGLAGTLAQLPTAPASFAGGRTLGSGWGGLLAAHGWARVNAELRGEPPAGAVTGVDTADVLTAVLHRLPHLPAGAAHVAALARTLPPAELARVAAGALTGLERTAYGESTAGAVSWLYAGRQLAEQVPALSSEAPKALRTLCIAASGLAPELLPAFLPAAAAAAAAERRRRDDSRTLAALYTAVGASRHGDDLQQLLRALAAELPRDHAAAMLSALAPRMTPATRDAVTAAAERGADAALAGEAVWQLGQRWAPGTVAPPAPAAKRVSFATPSPPSPDQWPATAELARLVSSIPHAPPPGGSEDAMQDPERVAALLRRVMALLSEAAWRPCRDEAAAAAAQLGALTAKRGWGDGDLAGLLCRLPAPATLRLLMVAEAASPALAARRPALLAALARWHGAAAVAEQLRGVFRDERSFALGEVVAMMADARGAMDAPVAAVGVGGGFVSSVVHVLGDMRGMAPPGAARYSDGYAAALLNGANEDATAEPPAARAIVAVAGASGRAPVTAGQLADLLCMVHTLAPAAAARALLAAVGASLGTPGRDAVAASLPGAARRTVGKGPELAAEVAALLAGKDIAGGLSGGFAAPRQAATAEGKLRAAAGSGGRGEQAGRAEAALRTAAAVAAESNKRKTKEAVDDSTQRERAESALRAAADSGLRSGGPQAAAAAGALRAAADELGTVSGADPAVTQLREIGAMVAASPATDPLPFLRRVLRGGAAGLLLRALPAEARRLPAAVTGPLLALALCEFDADAAEWEAALDGAAAAADAGGAVAPAVLSPRTRRAYAPRAAAGRAALLQRTLHAMQRLARPNRDGMVAAYAAVLRAAAAAPGAADYEPAAALLQDMVTPPAPISKSQGLGASGAARLAAALLGGPEEGLPACDVLVPALGRAFAASGGGDVAAWFARAAATELPRLPLDRAVLGLTLLQPSLAAAAGGLGAAARAVAEAHGQEATVGALRALWFVRHGSDSAAAAAISASASNDVIAALEMFAAGGSTALVPVPSADDDDGGADAAARKAAAAAEGASLVLLGIASLGVAARVAGRVLGTATPAGRMLMGSWWVLGATVSAAALLSDWIVSNNDKAASDEDEEEDEGGDEGSGSDDANNGVGSDGPFI
jgi:hypothetical protein